MRLVIFDVDGTLTDTMAVDARCFLRAFAEVCGFNDVDPDWSRYKNATDAGIFQEVFECRRGRAPSAAETRRFRDHLVGLLRAAAREVPFDPVRGAPDLLARLNNCEKYGVALATGCWADSARVKMASAGMCYNGYPSASADDARERENIIRLATERACYAAGEPFAVSVYVGDGVWDALGCKSLGVPFIGVGVGSQAERLSRAGAVQVFGDLTDTRRFLQVLQDVRA